MIILVLYPADSVKLIALRNGVIVLVTSVITRILCNCWQDDEKKKKKEKKYKLDMHDVQKFVDGDEVMLRRFALSVTGCGSSLTDKLCHFRFVVQSLVFDLFYVKRFCD